MDASRRHRDKAYRHLFKGSVLVSTLLEQDKERFSGREDATCFGQRLLDEGHIQSIVGSADFDDSVHLYRWSDESIVEEAKKLVSTTSSYIPKKRLIELLDFKNEDTSEENGFDMQHVQRQFQCNGTDDELELSRDRSSSPFQSSTESDSGSRCPSRLNIRSSPFSKSSGSLCGSTTPDGRDIESTERRYSLDALRNDTLDIAIDHLSKTGDRQRQFSEIQTITRRNPQHTKADLLQITHQRQPQHTKIDLVGSKPTRTSHQTQLERTRDPQHTILDFVPQKQPQHTKINLVTDRARRSPQHTSVDFISFVDFQMTPPVSPLQNKDFYQHSIVPDMTSSPEQSAASEQQDEDAHCDQTKPSHFDMGATCRYDGVEMPALDLENLNFDTLRPSTEKMVTDSLDVMQTSLDTMEVQQHGFSDNEKQLLEQMKMMQAEHQNMIINYEEKLDSLMKSIDGIKTLVEYVKTRDSGDKKVSSLESKTDSQKEADQEQQERSKHESSKQLPESTQLQSNIPAPTPPHTIGGDGPPPPPPPPPPLSLVPSMAPMILQPSKLPRKPSIKMRPLFWSRIILDSKAQEATNFWHSATEPNFKVEEFEKLFGKTKDTSAPEKVSIRGTLSPTRGRAKIKAAKILEENRSRAVGIKMRSLHCDLEEIKQAVYKLDFSKVEMDSLHSLAQMRATDEELCKIQQHLKENPCVPLDQPEEFLWELSKMPYFPGRMQCLVLKKRFSETLFNIDQQLATVQNACAELMKSASIRSVLELILAFGNYMNGGTQRGQADGFDLSILSKLNDVKAMDNSMTFLSYIVRHHCKEHEEHAGKKEAEFPLPDQSVMTSAAATSFAELTKELNQLKLELELYSKKAEEIYMNSDRGTQQPFKDQMDDFFDSAEHMLQVQKVKVDETKKEFDALQDYYVFRTKNEITSEVYFGIWATFLEEYRRCWKEEQRKIARKMFEKVEQKRKERMLNVKRRASVAVADDNNNTNGANLKQKFNALRRRSEQVHTVKLLRSQSVNNMIEPGDEDCNESRVTKSFSDYPSSSSTPSPISLKPSEILKHRFSGHSTASQYDQEKDQVFSHLHEDHCRPVKERKAEDNDQSRLISTFRLNLKKELKPAISVPNPITNVPDEVTLRRDLNNISPQLHEVHPMHERIMKRRSRVFTDDETSDAQSPTFEENTLNTDIKTERPQRERPPTRPKSFMNLDEYACTVKRTSSPTKSQKGPIKIDYMTDFLPANADRDENYVNQSFAMSRDLSVLRSTENLAKNEESPSASPSFSSSVSSSSISSISPSSQFQTSTSSMSLFNNSPHRCSSVERLFTTSNTLQLTSRSRREKEPPAEDVAPSEREYSEALRKTSRARAQSVGAAH